MYPKEKAIIRVGALYVHPDNALLKCLFKKVKKKKQKKIQKEGKVIIKFHALQPPFRLIINTKKQCNNQSSNLLSIFIIFISSPVLFSYLLSFMLPSPHDKKTLRPRPSTSSKFWFTTHSPAFPPGVQTPDASSPASPYASYSQTHRGS